MDINIVHGKGDFIGGMCSINDESFLVLNKRKSIDQRLNILAIEFTKINLKNIYLSPILREFISNSQQGLF
ncbi:MAG: hypothetical protein CMF81_00015 [Candidatus Marinimicrobia bacterium]|nr:hypothetical protein [Candidatus Neomarinimicrobiota bacterium]